MFPAEFQHEADADNLRHIDCVNVPRLAFRQKLELVRNLTQELLGSGRYHVNAGLRIKSIEHGSRNKLAFDFKKVNGHLSSKSPPQKKRPATRFEHMSRAKIGRVHWF